MRNFRVVRDDDADAALADVMPGHFTDSAVEHFNEFSLWFSSAVSPDDSYRHPIAVEQRQHLPRREVDIITAIVRNNEAEAVPVAADSTDDHVDLRGQAIVFTAVLDDLARPHHALQPIDEQAAHTLTFETEAC